MKNNLRPMPHVWLLLYTIDRISNSSAHTSRNHIHSGRITNHLRQAITSSTRGHFHNISLAIDTYTGLNIINGSLHVKKGKKTLEFRTEFGASSAEASVMS